MAAKIEWEPWVPPELCKIKRGKRGTVTCEKPKSLIHDEHAGRGKRGQWFFWKTSCCDLMNLAHICLDCSEDPKPTWHSALRCPMCGGPGVPVEPRRE